MPELRQVLLPFREALMFQRRRSPMTADNFYSLIPEARPRAFTISGLQRYSSLLEASRLVETAIAEGMTMSDFTDRLGEIIDANGGTILSPDRLELIHQNAIATSYCAGRYAQLTDPDVLDARPIWQYPLGPHDDHTSEICLALEGFVARYDDPVWNHIFPPNHHKERHWTVLSLTPDQAAEKGIYSSEGNPKLGPVIDGREILPDPGFSFAPKDIFAADDRAFVDAVSKLDPMPAKTPADYALGSLFDAATQPAVTQPPAEDWDAFRAGAGIEGDRGIVLDAGGDGVWITQDTFDRLGDRVAPGTITSTLLDAAEVWYAPEKRNGLTVFVKRYFGVVLDADGKPAVVALERSPEGWLMDGWIVTDEAALEALRRGLLVSSKAGNA